MAVSSPHRVGAYLSISEETTLVPDVFGPDKRRWGATYLGAGTVVRVAKHQPPSPVTNDTTELYVQWEDCIGRQNFGWLPANVALTEKRTINKLRYRSCNPKARLSPWAQLRAQFFDGGAGRLTLSQWLQNTHTKKEAAVLALIVREFGGRVTEHDDVRTLATRTRRMVIPNVGLSKESQMQLSTQKSTSKGTPIILPSSKSTSGKGEKSSSSSKKTVSSTKTKKGKKTAHIGRMSKFAGCTFKKLVKENPRNAGSVGYKMWDKLRTGMTYEQYIANGGGRSHLAWDIAHGNVKVIRGSK